MKKIERRLSEKATDAPASVHAGIRGAEGAVHSTGKLPWKPPSIRGVGVVPADTFSGGRPDYVEGPYEHPSS